MKAAIPASRSRPCSSALFLFSSGSSQRCGGRRGVADLHARPRGTQRAKEREEEGREREKQILLNLGEAEFWLAVAVHRSRVAARALDALLLFLNPAWDTARSLLRLWWNGISKDAI